MIPDINDIWKRERASRGKWSLWHEYRISTKINMDKASL